MAEEEERMCTVHTPHEQHIPMRCEAAIEMHAQMHIQSACSIGICCSLQHIVIGYRTYTMPYATMHISEEGMKQMHE